jgi:hypothetical protein
VNYNRRWAGDKGKGVFRGFPGSLVEIKEEQFRGDGDELRVTSRKGEDNMKSMD